MIYPIARKRGRAGGFRSSGLAAEHLLDLGSKRSQAGDPVGALLAHALDQAGEGGGVHVPRVGHPAVVGAPAQELARVRGADPGLPDQRLEPLGQCLVRLLPLGHAAYRHPPGGLRAVAVRDGPPPATVGPPRVAFARGPTAPLPAAVGGRLTSLVRLAVRGGGGTMLLGRPGSVRRRGRPRALSRVWLDGGRRGSGLGAVRPFAVRSFDRRSRLSGHRLL